MYLFLCVRGRPGVKQAWWTHMPGYPFSAKQAPDHPASILCIKPGAGLQPLGAPAWRPKNSPVCGCVWVGGASVGALGGGARPILARLHMAIGTCAWGLKTPPGFPPTHK